MSSEYAIAPSRVPEVPLLTRLTALALKRPVSCLMVMLSLVVMGLITTKLLPLEYLPSVNVPLIVVQIDYPNATPAEVEQLITRPIEESLATMNDIIIMSSSSKRNSSSVRLKMTFETDLNSKILEVREKVEMIRHLLPDDVKQINIRKFSSDDLPIIELDLNSTVDLSKHYNFLYNMLSVPIQRINGVGKVDMYGVEKPFIEIKLDPDLLALNRIDQQKLIQTLQESNFLSDSSSAVIAERRFTIDPSFEFQHISDIKNLLIAPNVHLSDIATINMTLPEQSRGSRVNGKYSVGMAIYKESDSNIVALKQGVTEIVEQLKNHPKFKEINIAISRNEAEKIEKSLSNLWVAGLVGSILSFIVLYFFLRSARISLIVVTSVPMALCCGLTAMYFLDYSLNLLTLAGLFIAVGLLIDNSVVVCDSILQSKHATGTDYEQKILKGVSNVSIAIISSTLTTTIVFLPLIMGEETMITIFIKQIAVAICFPLLASLVISKTVIPLLLFNSGSKLMTQTDSNGKLVYWYQNCLHRIFKHPKLTGLAALLLIISYFITSSIVSDNADYEITEKDIDIVYHVQGEPKFSDVAQAVIQMENYLLDNKQAFEFSTINSRFTSNNATTSLRLNKEITLSLEELKEKIQRDFPMNPIVRPSFNWQNSEGKTVKVSITGRSTEKLNFLATTLVNKLVIKEGFSKVHIDNQGNNKELLLKVKPEKIARLSLNTKQVANTIANYIRGQDLRSFQYGKHGETEIRLIYNHANIAVLDKLKQEPIIQHQGGLITLQELVDIEIHPVLQTINRENRKTSLTLTLRLQDINRQQAAEKIKNLMNSFEFPVGYGWHMGRKYSDDDKMKKQMITNILLAMVLIFMVMAALFESILLPLAILSSIGLAVIGANWTLAILGMNMEGTAYIGILILIGIVVNNGIVLIDQINKIKIHKTQLIDAILAACSQRVRAIMMTVTTTIISMLPLVYASNGKESYPMAVTLIGGLIFSTFTSLFFVPYFYWLLTTLGARSKQKLAKAKAFAQRKMPLRD